MARTPERPQLSRADGFSVIPETPADYARRYPVDHAENELDRGILNRIKNDHSPARRPELRGAEDTAGWNRYGYADGDGDDRFVVGRSTVPQNRRPR